MMIIKKSTTAQIACYLSEEKHT